MKIWIFLIMFVFFNTYSFFSYAAFQDGIVAIVNNRIILNSDIEKFIFLLKTQKEDTFNSIKENFLKEKVIQKLILENVLLNQADNLNINISNEKINQIIQNITDQKKLYLLELKKNILFHDKNSLFRYDDYRNNIKKALTIKILQESELYKNINISQKEVNNLFANFIRQKNKDKKINVSYILVPFLNGNIKNSIYHTQSLAESIIRKINNGYSYKNFYDIYAKNNDFFLTKDLSWINFIDLQKMFSHSLKITKKGEILGPFLEKEGFYILKINDIQHKKDKIITELNLQEIFIKSSLIMNSDAIKNNILTIYKKLKKGVYDFNYAIKNFAQYDNESNKQGNLGWILLDTLDNNFQKVLIHLKKNEISEPIQSNMGWHIFKILNKNRFSKYYLTEKNKAYNVLLTQKILHAREKWIKDLIDFSYIYISK